MATKSKKPVVTFEKQMNQRKQVLSIIMIIAVIIAALIGSFYLYRQYDRAKKLITNPAWAAQEELRNIIEKASRLIELPSEQPTLATVSDKAKLADQPFFARAKNGDKVLIYTESKKVYLYRPSSNKIIEVTFLQISSSSSSSSSAEAVIPANPLRVAILNGTTISGLAAQTEKALLTEKNISITVVKKDDANSSDYSSTLVVDLTGVNEQTANQIADLLQAEVASMPESEDAPEDADILIILGKK